MSATTTRDKGYKGVSMEGSIARWYAKTRRSGDQIAQWRKQAAELTTGLPVGANILEVAPGPGYMAIELARLGRFHVSALDVSRTFVEIATANARQEDVSVDFHLGNASAMPFADNSFDLIVCQAAFKNFSQPVEAMNEMWRILRPVGVAIIDDMDKSATNAAIAAEVAPMRLGWLNALFTRQALGSLRGRAYTVAQFQRMAADSAFGSAEIRTGGIGLEVRLTKHG
jgi:ubiquinone/menaquinone biosynthesis C-methylase UbiE